ncbi:MAG: hypothetical protein A2474_05450 [Elusimicrobia bacterium RIFOXYC2_FULL_34_12]|nr:MAG: hypothetical protein A2474_05450 [Elusimicrobia bacterium RIFOXYC2_FULL_34_12]OGS38015.1 MAG: hypothetical protein A2551_04970 [Elusimicrobia bacterium RIFOXYD2_FULL_34_30]HAM38695.1 thiol:disulfide interchange protein [Elusimicrobiota bacterium]
MKYKNIFLILTFNFLLFSCLYSADLGIDVGNKTIDFSLNKLSSTTSFKISEYINKKPVLINFFATWCPYCVQEIPELNRFYKEYNDKGLIIVSINIQEKYKKVESFAKAKKILYEVLFDSNAEVSNKFKVYGIPTNILVDSKGIIVFRGNNLPEEKEIEKILPKQKNVKPLKKKSQEIDASQGKTKKKK